MLVLLVLLGGLEFDEGLLVTFEDVAELLFPLDFCVHQFTQLIIHDQVPEPLVGLVVVLCERPVHAVLGYLVIFVRFVHDRMDVLDFAFDSEVEITEQPDVVEAFTDLLVDLEVLGVLLFTLEVQVGLNLFILP
eukprot:CAMPEP_0116899920 /NCGR_PEP_ID=MMETSP0467-20121206/8391_1 /TAXON_ID=283647 /ORGANISM="Mesodinium pulex, Strain SPMC105" /LENGTH=133 /DNA_ID=CAMNT_0004573027 /DNA_START=429 /DNA_END=830 /DNA_ORIENTATION=-